jgi:hypothetical protein
MNKGVSAGLSYQIRNFLQKNSTAGFSVAEICGLLGISNDKKKFVSSILIRFSKSGQVLVSSSKPYSYMWNQDPNDVNARKNAPNPPKQTKAQRMQDDHKADIRRRIAEEAKKKAAAEAAKIAAENAEREARRMFLKLTGYTGSNPTEAKAAFRKAALRLHPDQGGNAEEFAKLNEAWECMQKTLK